MIGESEPKFQWGQAVRAIGDLVNDGTYPGRVEGETLVKAGTRGEIVQVGTHMDFGSVVYLVEFAPNLVVGCLETELAPA